MKLQVCQLLKRYENNFSIYFKHVENMPVNTLPFRPPPPTNIAPVLNIPTRPNIIKPIQPTQPVNMI